MVLDKATYIRKWKERFRSNDTFQIQEQDFAEFAEDTADSFGAGAPAGNGNSSSGNQLKELVLPQAVVQGGWYIYTSGVWEARRSFTASASPVAGPNWRAIVLFNSNPTPTPTAVLGEFVTTFYSPTEWRVRLPAVFPRTQATIDQLLAFATAAKHTPPASYSDTLSSSNTQVEGITADISGTQKMRVTPIAGVGAATLVLQLLDSSDGNRLSQFGFAHEYAGEFYLFQKKDSSFYEMPWPDTDTILTV